ncbi:YybH family protein [Methylophaga sp.]|uniref:YybH family protein n=1 Tax=Methylophaga sp. TaxID=2024840 RepID=UPI003A8D7220
MTEHPIINQIKAADEAIMAEDFDTLLDIYTDDAVLVVHPGMNAVGKTQIRQAFEKIAVYFQHGLQVTQEALEILETGDTALVLANTIISAPDAEPTTRQATYVFVKNSDDIWRCAIDNSYGHAILQSK